MERDEWKDIYYCHTGRIDAGSDVKDGRPFLRPGRALNCLPGFLTGRMTDRPAT